MIHSKIGLATAVSVLALLWPAAIAQTVKSPGTTASTGGAASVSPGKQFKPGFACGAGMSWAMDGGIAKCKVPDPTSMPGAPCSAWANYAAGTCIFDLPAAGHGVTVSAKNKQAGWSGVLSITCTNGTWGGSPTYTCTAAPTVSVTVTPASVSQGTPVTMTWTTTNATAAAYTCTGVESYSGALAANGSLSQPTPNVGTINCTAVATGPTGSSAPFPFSWVVNPSGAGGCGATSYTWGNCIYPIPALSVGASSGPVSNIAASMVGSVVASCGVGGILSYSSATCTDGTGGGGNPSGGGGTGNPNACMLYPTSYGNCSFSASGNLDSADSVVINTYTPGYAGSIKATCSSATKTLVWSEPSCSPAPCAATLHSDGTCQFALPATASGDIVKGTVTAPGGYTGQVSALCTLGSFSGFFGSSCIPPGGCAAAASSFGSCTYPAGALSSGETVSVATSTAGYSGSAMASCSNGVLQWSAQTCSPVQGSPGCATSSSFAGACAYSVGALASGQSVSVDNVTAGYAGTATATCVSGIVSWSGQTCNAAPVGCPGGSTSFGACSFSAGSLSSGQSASVSTSTAGHSGSAMATCNAGALSWSGHSCTATQSTCQPASNTSGACTYATGELPNGQTATVLTSTAGYVGNATATCTAGAVSWSGQTCVAESGDCVAMPNFADGLGCVYDVPATPNGASVSGLMNKASGYAGKVSGQCQNKAWINVIDTCAPVAAPACQATVTVFGACTYSIPMTASGATSVGGVLAPSGFTGSVTASCSNGSFTYTGATCTPP